jgi:hypothetical protein
MLNGQYIQRYYRFGGDHRCVCKGALAWKLILQLAYIVSEGRHVMEEVMLRGYI